MGRPIFIVFLSCALMSGMAGQVRAALPFAVSYQGKLTDPAGSPVADGQYDLKFDLYAAQSGGTPLTTQNFENVSTSAGLFTVLLDIGGFLDGSPRYLQIGVRPGSQTGAHVVLTPRQPVVAAAHAVMSQNSGSLGGLPSSRFLRYDSSGNAGIGTDTPRSKLQLQGTLWVSGNTLPLPQEAAYGVGMGYIHNGTSQGLPVNAGYLFAGDYTTASQFASFEPKALVLNPQGGYVGVGTYTPSSELEVRGSLTLDAWVPEGPTIFTASPLKGAANRYIHLIDTVSNGNASGLKAGGVLVADAYNYASPAKNDLIVKGKVGIGSPNPNLSLRIGPTQTLWTTASWLGGMELENAMAIAWRPNSGGSSFGIGQSGGMLYFIRSSSAPGTSTGSAAYDMVISDSGNVGVGTLTPLEGRLQVESPGVGIRAKGFWGIQANGLGTGTVGVWGENASSNAYGVYGKATGAQSTGVFGINTGTGPGVQGFGSGSNQGVLGTSDTGQGVYGKSNTWHGVYGYSNTGTGVEGVSRDFDGVWGMSHHANHSGVSGHNAAGGWAAQFSGKVNVQGTLYKNGGAFRIDHPLDPENKYLAHSFVESPEMMNVYNGNVTTDADGNAVVSLPSYFEALNRDFRYQLTVIGQFAQAIVSEEISDNQFGIKTDKPNVKVSWQVTGVRHDPWAEGNPIVVEQEKPAAEKGKYLAAKEYGKPESLSVIYARLKGHLSQEPAALTAPTAPVEPK